MGKERRVQQRTKAAIPLEIDGTDENGESFKESVTALEVSRRGTSFLTGRSYGEESQVSVTIPGRGPFRPQRGNEPRLRCARFRIPCKDDQSFDSHTRFFSG